MDNPTKIEEKITKAMDLARYELKSAQILLDAEQYRDSITHSYYAMFTAEKQCYLLKILKANPMKIL
ncbi:MAG: HEPN domain-containing protein [Methanobrevibacter sp.]|nr:HEPN domain-containing protein [Methanobrevibacter sp.]